LLIGGSPDQGRNPASEVNDGACPEKPDHLRGMHPVTTDRDPLAGQVVHDPAATAAGILQVKGIDPGHDPQRRSGQPQQRTLAADAELGVVVIDQLA